MQKKSIWLITIIFLVCSNIYAIYINTQLKNSHDTDVYSTIKYKIAETSKVDLAGQQTVNSKVELTKVGPEIGEIFTNQLLFTTTNKFENPNKLVIEGDKYKILYFLPSINTPVCIKQTKELELFARNNPNIGVYIVSLDTPYALNQFKLDNQVSAVKLVSMIDQKDYLKQINSYVENYYVTNRMALVLDNKNAVVHKNYQESISDETKLEHTYAFLKEQNLQLK